MSIKIGDYVRTKYGKIGKIIDFNKAVVFSPITFKEKLEDIKNEETMLVVDTNYNFDDENDSYFEKDIVKSSPKIIDLIEVRRLCEWTKNNSNNQRPIYKRPDRFMD